jgi:hypothetical protein
MRIKIVSEKKVITEITKEQVVAGVSSKKFRKKLRKALEPLVHPGNQDEYGMPSEEFLVLVVSNIRLALSYILPRDITDAQMGAALNWYKNVLLTDKEELKDFIDSTRNWIRDVPGFLAHNLEKFFHYQEFMDEKDRDINNHRTRDELFSAVERAEPKYQAHIEKKKYLDAKEGSELLYEDENWKIYIPRNKGAACELGKGTEWCTAAPGLDYYEQYHSDEDPLYIFIHRNGKKFQFHYASMQFMNENDERVDAETFIVLHGLLASNNLLSEKDSDSVEVYPSTKSISIRQTISEDPDPDQPRKKKRRVEKWYDYELFDTSSAYYEEDAISRVGAPAKTILSQTRASKHGEPEETVGLLVNYIWAVEGEHLGEIYFEIYPSTIIRKIFLRDHVDEGYEAINPQDVALLYSQDFDVFRDWTKIVEQEKEISDFIERMNQHTINYADEMERKNQASRL